MYENYGGKLKLRRSRALAFASDESTLITMQFRKPNTDTIQNCNMCL